MKHTTYAKPLFITKENVSNSLYNMHNSGLQKKTAEKDSANTSALRSMQTTMHK